jgi:hypothetical protein
MRHRVVIIEPVAAAAQRLARVATVASRMQEAIVVDTVAAAVEHAPTALGCSAALVDDVSQVPELRRLPAVVWTNEPSSALFQRAAAEGDSIVAFLGWPTYMAAPRSWEVLLALRALTAGGPGTRRPVPTASNLLATGAEIADWRVATTTDRDDVIAEIGRFAGAVAGRQAEQINAVAWELVMNALYDAPTTPDGRPMYAHDRSAHVQLLPEHAPTCRVGSDGNHFVVEVVDPFGGLRRPVVLRSLARVLAAQKSTEGVRAALDTSHGGAGLGLHRVFSGAASTLIHVVPKQETRVCAWFDLTLSARDLRGMPGSLHFYRSDSL